MNILDWNCYLSAFYPKHIGVIDYHGSHRNYGREELGGINLNLAQEELTCTDNHHCTITQTNILISKAKWPLNMCGRR